MPRRRLWLRLGRECRTLVAVKNAQNQGPVVSLCVLLTVCFVVLHLGMAEEEAGRDSEASPPLERSKSAFYKKEGTCDEDLLASLTLTPSCQMTLTASATTTSHVSPSPNPLKNRLIWRLLILHCRSLTLILLWPSQLIASPHTPLPCLSPWKETRIIT